MMVVSSIDLGVESWSKFKKFKIYLALIIHPTQLDELNLFFIFLSFGLK